ncbi:MAG: ADP-ribosylglycohydrolase family protein [Candidatus Obscuribacterales bacterium]
MERLAGHEIDLPHLGIEAIISVVYKAQKMSAATNLSQADLLYDRFAGVLLGTAVGDALGLYLEGLEADSIQSQFSSPVDRYYLLGNIGFVSDDTEQSALIAQSLIKFPPDLDYSVNRFRAAMLGWFCRMPFGVGQATSYSCMKILMGSKNTGIRSAGNGAAMRAAILGAFFYDDSELRNQYGIGLAHVTHTDARGVEGALFVAELTAACIRAGLDTQAEVISGTGVGQSFAGAKLDSENNGKTNGVVYGDELLLRLYDQSIEVVHDKYLKEALSNARELALEKASVDDARKRLGCSGFVNHSVPLAVFTFLRFGDDPLTAIQSVIMAGGDTDSNAAIVGALCGALHGESGLPMKLISQINDGPFGPEHLRSLSKALVETKRGESAAAPGYLWPVAFARNVAVIPLLLSQTLLRLARRGKIT